MELAPISTETKNEKIKEEKSFQFISNKQNNFNIIFQNCSSYIKLYTNIQNELINKEYEKKYYLEDLKKNKFLSLCDSIDEVYEQLILELQKKNNKMIIEKEKEIEIIIPVELVKVKEIKFILLEKIKSNEDLFKYIFNELKNLKNEDNNLKNEIKLLKDENKNIKDENNNLKNDIKLLKEEINKLKENISNTNNKIKDLEGISEFNLKSSIINNQIEKQNILIKWIKEKTKKYIINFKLIFKMSINGSNSEDFYKYCKDQGTTLVLIKTTKNKIFGGFTPLNWEKGGGEKKDLSNQTFIF